MTTSSTRRPRISAPLMVSALALVVAASGAGYAAATIGSKQIRDNSVQSVDVKNRTLTGQDIKKHTLPSTVLDGKCRSGEAKAFGGCVRKKSAGPVTYQVAMDGCNQRGGRLPTTAELFWISAHGSYQWADGNASMYEFTGDYTVAAPFEPLAFDKNGNSYGPGSFSNASFYHCVTR